MCLSKIRDTIFFLNYFQSPECQFFDILVSSKKTIPFHFRTAEFQQLNICARIFFDFLSIDRIRFFK